jgi:spore germination protein KC
MKQIRFKILLAICLLACVFFLNGCWGKREVEELAPLMGVGIDLGQTPGKLLITEQYALPRKGAAAAEVEARTYSIEAASGREINEKTSEILKRVPFMGSLKVIVIGEDAARTGFNDILDFAQRFSEFRRSIYLIVTKGKAQDFLNLKLPNDELPSMYLISKLEMAGNISTFPKISLGHYLTVLGRENTAPILPAVEIINSGEGGIEFQVGSKDGGQEARIKGAGVLKGDQLVDFLTDKETKGYMWLENDIKYRFLNTVGSPDNNVYFGGHVLKSRTKYKVIDNHGTKGLQYQIRTSVAVDEVLGLRQRLSDTEWGELMRGAEEKFANVITTECQLSIQKERKLGLDYLGIGRHIEELNPAYWESIKGHWEKEIANFPVLINVQVSVHNSGMSNSSVTTRY